MLVDWLGFPIPLEWLVPTVLLIVGMAGYIYKVSTQKQILRNYVRIYQPSGASRVRKLKPEEITHTHLKFSFENKEYFASFKKPWFMQNLKTKKWENMFDLPEGSSVCDDPETRFVKGFETKSAGRIMQEHASWLGHIRAIIGVGEFSLKRHGYLLLIMLGMGVLLGIVIDHSGLVHWT